MKPSLITQIVVSLLAIVTLVCVLTGKHVFSLGFGALEYSFQDALFNPDTGFKSEFVLYLRLLLFAMPLTAVLAWIKKGIVPLFAFIVSALMVIMRFATTDFSGGFNGYTASAYIVDFMPIVIAVACLINFLLIYQERKREGKPPVQ
jgi:hypothetical protein